MVQAPKGVHGTQHTSHTPHTSQKAQPAILSSKQVIEGKGDAFQLDRFPGQFLAVSRGEFKNKSDISRTAPGGTSLKARKLATTFFSKISPFAR
ncbi:MAG TPA: hypothetical protein VGO47_05495 [Chlamydiales bacterium]|jgi:hypothetical protein|nr:hypothetical protein [Chlamydiales bacterium]